MRYQYRNTGIIIESGIKLDSNTFKEEKETVKKQPAEPKKRSTKAKE